ncbi:hypothetical protein ACRE_013240 [Hapsidospora chrysogenum ATCC 11550]|uniref:Uncharacterized protein n=1 Tax=Hapsidospora chrysogenum (strain ATCC 11550 / CBS 779.69 / DSM 880 / IAM 14645 / JCM 23072 / IMI 49137) TaxID=857340 RepID=A0A086TED1_HAPC1|nr:hypothetical protein ACRE_013240 [Hapsidospora chrysogenum ATCC 11550]
MTSEQPSCQACTYEATHANGLFCRFHAKQAFGLYKGYKRRNAQLDALDANPPAYLKDAEVPLANENFQKIEEESVLREIHSHLFDTYVLLGTVIDARKLHHKHFYPLQVDYGHQAYLDKLSSRRHIVLRALGALDKRTAEVSYRKAQWLTWVRRVQEIEEANREKEQKKVKQEAALFMRHMKTLQARLDMMRQKEEKMRQDAHFLWIEVLDGGETAESNTKAKTRPAGEGQAPPKRCRKKPKPKAGAPSTSEPGPADMRGQSKLLAMQEKREKSIGSQSQDPDKSNIETEEEMRKRLREGDKKNLDNVWGPQVVGTLKNPYETLHETAPMADFEVESVVSDIREIKRLLFSRLLLGQASLLPAALRASSVEEFLNDAGVTETDLRDLCLKVSEPSLQDIRDARADFTRVDDAEEDVENETDDDDEEDDLEETMEDLINGAKRYAHLHTDHWEGDQVYQVSLFTQVQGHYCGKSIWNHASEKAMSRDGWLQFSVMAKDCDLKHASKLCRNRAEFSDLNLLTLWQYFPASNWAAWGRDSMIQQLQELGFFPYFIDFDAESMTMYNVVITELRHSWRIAEPRDAYKHMEPLLRTLTRDKDTMRTRKIKPGEDVNTLWDTLMDDRMQFLSVDTRGKSVTYRDSTDLHSPYMFYSAANAAEDKVLFPDESDSDKKKVPFREFKNGVNGMENGFLPSVARELARDLVALRERDPSFQALEEDKNEDNIWVLPRIWETGLMEARRENPKGERLVLLKRTGLEKSKKKSPRRGIRDMDKMEGLERDRSGGFKETFRAADLEPGATERFLEAQEKINTMLGSSHSGPTDWVWWLADILDWLGLRADYEEYAHDPSAPWPHSFIADDLLDVTALVTKFLDSSQCEDFRKLALFDPQERAKTRPDRRTPTSYEFRDKKFFAKFVQILHDKDNYYADIYPMDWSLAVRPIIARLYRAGVVAPAYFQNDVRLANGLVTANTEPHRPDKLDMFIEYEDRAKNYEHQRIPPGALRPDEWPRLRPIAQKFAGEEQGARFAVLRLWSAPHFYPLMLGLPNRQVTGFLDSAGRA